ncbi:MAG: class I SAM-dependent methyltransferase [Armatimonadota bacterium]|nr:class I SAM-dependent methyltransferase [Armatimonadota bacterium]MDR7520314.1 class I SAM-dependent methyltransferase [Armatimonadota bacterium]MDR7550174.1 class I SAM-dependent methyltransferase [Armatimonadota bacterium]
MRTTALEVAAGAAAADAAAAAGISARPCLLCGEPPRLRFRRYGYPIVACPRCGLTYCAHTPTEPELVAFYSEGYFKGAPDRRGYHDYEADERLIKAGFVPKLEAVERCAPRRGVLLDVGCAWGYFMDLARARGWRAYGIDASACAVSAARRRGLDVIHGTSLGGFRDGSFDAVTMWDVLEHLPDPLEALRHVWRMLKPGGVLGLSTGRIDSALARIQGRRSRIFNPPQHLFFFGRTTLKACLAAAGFRTCALFRDHKVVSLRYILHLHVSLYPRSPLCGVLRRLMRVRFNPAIPIPIPDTMVVLARKDPAGTHP